MKKNELGTVSEVWTKQACDGPNGEKITPDTYIYTHTKKNMERIDHHLKCVTLSLAPEKIIQVSTSQLHARVKI